MVNNWVMRANQKLKDGSTVFVGLGYFFAIIYALLIIIPLYFVVVSAFKNNDQIILTPLALPAALNFTKFIEAQANVNLIHALLVSVIITIGAEVVTLLVAFPAAYAVARIQTRLSAAVEAVFSLGFLIPGLAILMPVYLMLAKAGLLYNPIALIILYPALNFPRTMGGATAQPSLSRYGI